MKPKKLRELYERESAFKEARDKLHKHARAGAVLGTIASAAGNRLIDEIIRQGLTEFGPITSHLEYHRPTDSYRRVWETKESE